MIVPFEQNDNIFSPLITNILTAYSKILLIRHLQNSSIVLNLRRRKCDLKNDTVDLFEKK